MFNVGFKGQICPSHEIQIDCDQIENKGHITGILGTPAPNTLPYIVKLQ